MVVMWLWIFYRAKQDGAWTLGVVHPWDAHGSHGHHDDHHGHHGHGELKWTKEVGEKPVLVVDDEDH